MKFAYQTQLRGALPTLRPGAAHIWQFDASAAFAHRCEGLELLNPSEHARAKAMRHAVSRQEFVAGRTVLRLLLAHYLGQDPRSLALEKHAKGKPFLACNSLAFNVAHSGGRVLLAFAREGAIGVDLEEHSEAVDVDGLATQVFPHSLCGHMQDLTEGERQREFFALWAAREAVSKAHGGGLSAAIDWAPLEASKDRHVRTASIGAEPAQQFNVVPLACGESYSGALASSEAFSCIDMLCVPPATLLSALLPVQLLSVA